MQNLSALDRSDRASVCGTEIFGKWGESLISEQGQCGHGESNSDIQLGKLVFYHWTTPAETT